MRAVYLFDNHLYYRPNYPRPEPAAHEALVQVSLAGICGTDLQLRKGYKGGFEGIPGHEFVGTVAEAADESWIGRRVVGTLNIRPTERCAACATTADCPEHCPERTVLGLIERDGAFAEYVCLPTANLRPVPDIVTDEEAVFTEPLAAALRLREQVHIRPTDHVGVLGPGRLGMLVGAVLREAGTAVTMLGRRKSSLQLAKRWRLNTTVADKLPDNSFDILADTTGHESGWAEGMRLLRPGGTLLLKSTFTEPSKIDLAEIVVNEITVVGSRCGPFTPALRLLAQGAIPVADMIDGDYPLVEVHEAFAHAARAGVRKILLRP